ncbi:hypothetical protein PPACK8108_LOCUS2733 [Phakopsora pachyrhizi]|uniref:Uncharacterized protein n=1 Tax=Phakopsora pachyrhizi TaxID=170000 RepID=A0AAV0AL31_PHAPC|nr:hypothetical protein PPACK8108_LOCUS2733 [Phakopsora pachyrhizi]
MSLKQSGFQVLQALQLSYWENKLSQRWISTKDQRVEIDERPQVDIDEGPRLDINEEPMVDLNEEPKIKMNEGWRFKGLTKLKLGKEGKGVMKGLIVIPYGAPIAWGFSLTKPNREHQVWGSVSKKGLGIPPQNICLGNCAPAPLMFTQFSDMCTFCTQHGHWKSNFSQLHQLFGLPPPDIGHPETVYTHSVAHSSSSWQTPASPQQNTWTNAPAPPTTQSPETGPSV